MSAPLRRSSEFKNYPYLDVEEFAETCHHLDRRYSQATLGPVRRRWKLRACRALDLSYSTTAEYTTYIQIVRPLEGDVDDADLAACLDNFNIGGDTMNQGDTRDLDMMEAEEADTVWGKFSVANTSF